MKSKLFFLFILVAFTVKLNTVKSVNAYVDEEAGGKVACYTTYQIDDDGLLSIMRCGECNRVNNVVNCQDLGKCKP
jgi:hypothetical protein